MQDPAKQSTFVTVVAWLVMVFSGLSAATGLLQSVMVSLMMPIPLIAENEADRIPYAMRLIFENFHLVVFALTAFWVLTFVSAVGLLKRREWARQVMTGIFIVGAISVAVIAAVQQAVVQWMFADGTDIPAEADAFMLAFRAAAIIFAVVFLAAFAWIAVRLNSPVTRAEFRR